MLYIGIISPMQIWVYYIPLINLPFYHCVTLIFISGNIFCLKVQCLIFLVNVGVVCLHLF